MWIEKFQNKLGRFVRRLLGVASKKWGVPEPKQQW